MRTTTGALLALATLCAGGAAATRAAAAPAAMVRLNGVMPAAVSAATATALGPVDAKRMMSLTLVLRAPHQQDLQRIASAVIDPRSPRFRHFLTFAQWKRRFAPSDEAQPSYHPGRVLSRTTTNLPGRGTARDVAGRRTASGAAVFRPSICCGSPAGGALDLPDLYSSEAYDFGALQRFSKCCNPAHLPGGTPRESSIAIIGQNEPNPNDLLTFAKTYGLAMSVTQDQINGPSCCDGEMTFDIETATAMANSFGSAADTAHVYAYEGGGAKISDLLDAWEAAHSANQARVASRASERPRAGRGSPSATSARSSTR